MTKEIKRAREKYLKSLISLEKKRKMISINEEAAWKEFMEVVERNLPPPKPLLSRIGAYLHVQNTLDEQKNPMLLD